MVAVTLGLWALPVHADETADDVKAKYAPCTRKPSPAEEQVAKQHHKDALEAFDRKEFPRAAELWTQAYAADCSRPRVFLNLGSAFDGAGDSLRALAMFELLVERAPTEAPPELPTKMHQLRLKLKEPTKPAEPPKEKPAAPPSAPAPTEKPLGVAPWVILGGGGALMITGGALLGVGLSQAGSAADECEDPEARTGCPQQAIDDGESGELMSQIGQGLLYGGAGVAALGLVLELAVNGEQPVTEPSAKVQPLLGPGGGGVVVTVKF